MAKCNTRNIAQYGTPYEFDGYAYETDSIKISINSYHRWYGAIFHKFIVNPTEFLKTYTMYDGYGDYGQFAITYEFKNGVVIFPESLYLKAKGDGYDINAYVYYLIDGEYVQQVFYDGTARTMDTTLTLPNIKTTSVKVKLTSQQIGTTAPMTFFQDIALAYNLQGSDKVKNAVTNVITSNTLFQKVTSPVEILED